jgi:hypothetical protein
LAIKSAVLSLILDAYYFTMSPKPLSSVSGRFSCKYGFSNSTYAGGSLNLIWSGYRSIEKKSLTKDLVV